MSMFSKITDLARKALDTQASASGTRDGSATDWREILRQAKGSLAGDGNQTQRSTPATPSRHGFPESFATTVSSASHVSDTDRAAIARYNYLLETADPHQIEQVHREAFQRLSPSQREQIDQRMRAELPTHEHPRSSEAVDLARAAARTEAGQPGLLRGLLARAGGNTSRTGAGMAGGVALGGAAVAAGGLLSVVAGGAILTSVAGPLLEQATNIGVDFEALASGINLEGLTGGVEGLNEGLTGGVEELTTGASEGISGLGDQLSELGAGFTPFGLDDLFGR